MKRYKIYAGLNGGFGGAHYQETKEFESEIEASEYAYVLACEEYESYGELHGLLTTEQAEEEATQNTDREDFESDQDYEDAITEHVQELFNEDREKWINYYVEEDKTKRWLITVDTNWVGTEEKYGAIAETKEELYDLIDELAYNNFIDMGGPESVLEELFPDAKEYTDDMREEASEVDHEYYSGDIEEFTGADEEFDQYDLVYGEEEY
jgi:hypothetical protein